MKTFLGRCSRSSYLLRAGRSGDRISVGASLYIPVQTGPGAHPDSYKMGTGSFPERGRGVSLATHLHLAPKLKKVYKYTFPSPLCLHGMFRVNFTF
jgi:hypothetical protein